MTGRATDGRAFDKLTDDESPGLLLDMLSIHPPPVVVGFLDFFVRTVEERAVFAHKAPCLGIRESCVLWVFVTVTLIELLYVVPVCF